MAQVRDRKAGAGSGASFSTLTPAFQPGDILVAAHSCDIGTPANMSISGTWNEIPPIGMVGPTFNTRAYWKPTGSDPASYTFTQDSGADGVAVIASLMDLAGTAPLNLGESFVLNAATMTASSLTPAGAGDLALIWAGAVASPGAARTWSGPAGWTPEIQRQSGIYTAGIMVSKVLTSGEPTGAATFTASGAMYRGQTLVLTFRAGASAVQKNSSDAAAASEQEPCRPSLHAPMPPPRPTAGRPRAWSPTKPYSPKPARSTRRRSGWTSPRSATRRPRRERRAAPRPVWLPFFVRGATGTEDVEIAFTTPGVEPIETDWMAAEWAPGSVGTRGATARILFGPGGTVSKPDGSYQAWVRVTAPPQLPVLPAGLIDVV